MTTSATAPKTDAPPPNSTALLDDLSNGIGQLGVELADVLGNLHYVADRVSKQSDQFSHLTEAATAMKPHVRCRPRPQVR